jgi:acyl carrier protein
MAPPEHAAAMIDYLRAQVLRDPRIALDAATPLISSGLVDSFALTEVLLQLERVTGRRIPMGKVRPSDFETVATMLARAEQVGTPRRA